MRLGILQLLSQQTFHNLLKNTSTKWLLGVFNLLLLVALLTAYLDLQDHQHTHSHYSEEVRERWENNPDKHPHRMAHYGYVAFRQKYPLSFFDYGMDSYLGNAVFLEAHRQNTINFSEASLSNGLLRFGELSAGLMLQILVPLLIFFWGFALIAGERELGTLRLLLSQGVSWSELIMGRTLGLFYLSLILLVPAVLLAFILLLLHLATVQAPGVLLSFSVLVSSYLLFLFIMSLLAVWVSAIAQTAKGALIRLIGCWLLFILILPKLSQVMGQVFHPTPAKIAFDTAVEHELVQLGDSHNPDDPHFQALKDSLLSAYQVSTTKELPINYSGFVMREGERLSTEVFRRHQAALLDQYQQQQDMVRWTALMNPYIAIKSLSMALAGTDFPAYRNFQGQAEAYRYNLAQTMNELQMEHISNQISSSADKRAQLSRQYWLDFPDFDHHQLSFQEMISREWLSILALLIWLSGLISLALFNTKDLKAF